MPSAPALCSDSSTISSSIFARPTTWWRFVLRLGSVTLTWASTGGEPSSSERHSEFVGSFGEGGPSWRTIEPPWVRQRSGKSTRCVPAEALNFAAQQGAAADRLPLAPIGLWYLLGATSGAPSHPFSARQLSARYVRRPTCRDASPQRSSQLPPEPLYSYYSELYLAVSSARRSKRPYAFSAHSLRRSRYPAPRRPRSPATFSRQPASCSSRSSSSLVLTRLSNRWFEALRSTRSGAAFCSGPSCSGHGGSFPAAPGSSRGLIAATPRPDNALHLIAYHAFQSISGIFSQRTRGAPSRSLRRAGRRAPATLGGVGGGTPGVVAPSARGSVRA